MEGGLCFEELDEELEESVLLDFMRCKEYFDSVNKRREFYLREVKGVC